MVKTRPHLRLSIAGQRMTFWGNDINAFTSFFSAGVFVVRWIRAIGLHAAALVCLSTSGGQPVLTNLILNPSTSRRHHGSILIFPAKTSIFPPLARTPETYGCSRVINHFLLSPRRMYYYDNVLDESKMFTLPNVIDFGKDTKRRSIRIFPAIFSLSLFDMNSGKRFFNKNTLMNKIGHAMMADTKVPRFQLDVYYARTIEYLHTYVGAKEFNQSERVTYLHTCVFNSSIF